MFEQILNIVLTALLTTVFLVFAMRWLFKNIAGSISSLTHLGGKLAGEASGSRRASKAVTQDVAKSILGSPQLSGIKMIAGQLGIDIDQMVEDHGAIETMNGITQVLGMLGIDPTSFLSQGLGSLTKGFKIGENKQVSELSKFG